jgi:hypothetical protein
VIESDKESEDESLTKLLNKLEELGYLKPAGKDVVIPDYLRQDLVKILGSQNFPDLPTFVIHILSNYAAQNSGQGELPKAEEDAVREKLKKLGYIS